MLTCYCVGAVQELEAKHTQLTEHNINLRVELDTVKAHLSTAESSLKSVAREHEIAVDDLDRRHRNESESLRQEGKRRMDDIITQHEDELRDLRRRFELEIEDERSLRLRELSQMTSQSALDKQQVQLEVENKNRELHSLRCDVDRLGGELDRE